MTTSYFSKFIYQKGQIHLACLVMGSVQYSHVVSNVCHAANEL
jgi:hypothetical protein